MKTSRNQEDVTQKADYQRLPLFGGKHVLVRKLISLQPIFRTDQPTTNI